MEDIKILKALSIVLGLIGITLLFTGILFQNHFPWITFRTQPYPQPPVTKPWQWVFFEISPFVYKLHVQGGVQTFQWYYKLDSTISGIFCLFGAVGYLISIFVKKRWISIFSSIITLFSLLVFGSTLPGYYPSTAWGSGAKLILYGSFSILTSVFLDYIAEDKKNDKKLLERLLQLWSHRSSNKE
jgi:hypothetical protein